MTEVKSNARLKLKSPFTAGLRAEEQCFCRGGAYSTGKYQRALTQSFIRPISWPDLYFTSRLTHEKDTESVFTLVSDPLTL